MSEFLLGRDAEGRLQIRRSDTGAGVAIDGSSQDYADFLRWIAGRPEAEWPAELQQLKEIKNSGRPQPPLFFSDEAPFICWWKEMPSLLHVHPVGILDVPVYLDLPTSAERFFEVVRTDASNATPSGLSSTHSNVWISDKLREELNRKIASESSDVRRLSDRTVDRTFVYVDISDFSKYTPGQQAIVIKTVGEIANIPTGDRIPGKLRMVKQHQEADLCIGDGYIFVLTDPTWAAYFAAYLASAIEDKVATREFPVEVHFRIGVHCGPVYHFWERKAKRWNYVGDGINGGSRVLEAIEKAMDDVVFVSDEVRRRIQGVREKTNVQRLVLNSLINRGRRADKHGKFWRVFEMTHTQVMPC